MSSKLAGRASDPLGCPLVVRIRSHRRPAGDSQAPRRRGLKVERENTGFSHRGFSPYVYKM
jgi:hypothetical protein